MANPTIQDRVSPSGPLSGKSGPGGGLTPPGVQIAGDHYITSEDYNAIFVAQLPPYHTNLPILTIYNSDGPVPVVRPVDSILAMDPAPDTQPLVAGTYLVLLQLEGGFITSFPLNDDNWGVLSVELEFSALDGSGAKTIQSEDNALPYCYMKDFQNPVGVLGKSTIPFVLTISEQEAAAADGFPVRRFHLRRKAAPDWPGVPVRFTDTSGYYELHKNSMFSVIRVR